MKNKTLKEIESFNKLNPRFVNRDILRQEAINHIKNCKNTENFATHNLCGFYYDEEKKELKPRCPIFCELCEWIMMLFNI